MGQTARTTKLLLDFSGRASGGINTGKREHLRATVDILNAARRFYLNFFLAHAEKLTARSEVISKKTGEIREGVISADNLLTWAEFQTVETADHPTPLPDWNFTQAFPDFPNRYRRAAHQGCDRQSTGLSPSHQELAGLGEKEREARCPYGYQPSHPIRWDLQPGPR